MSDLETWLAALTAIVQPTAVELTAAATIKQWSWQPTDTAGLYVRGLVIGRDHTTAEILLVDCDRRWVFDRHLLWLLGKEGKQCSA